MPDGRKPIEDLPLQSRKAHTVGDRSESGGHRIVDMCGTNPWSALILAYAS